VAGSDASRIPILLNLRDFIGKLDLEAYITSFLDRECKVVNPRIELFRAMNEVGIFLLIFDGFDEMAVKVDADTLESNLLEIEKLAASNQSKVMLTSRPEYFVSAREEGDVLSPTVNPFLTRTTHYEPLKILPWNEEQVESFLQKRVPLVKGASQPWTYYRDRIKKIGSLSDLSQRPVLLDMIVKTLPRMISSGETINLPNLYKSYLIGEMKRQKVLKKRTFLLSDDARLELLQELAVQVFSSVTQSITFADALKLIETQIAPPKHELEAHTRDFLTNSFLVRKGDDYRLSHKSILEFLVAMRLNEEIRSGDPVMFRVFGLNYQILGFLKELEPSEATLLRWIQLTRKPDLRDSRLGMNAAQIIVQGSYSALAGTDLSRTNLVGAQLFRADLRETKFNNTLLRDTILTGAKFFKRNLRSAKLGNTDISFYIVKPLETRDYTVHQFMDFALPKLGKNSLDMAFVHYTHRPEVFWEVTTPVASLSELDAIKDLFATTFNVEVAVFWDEHEELVRRHTKGV